MTANTRGLDIDSMPEKSRLMGKNYLFCIGIDLYQYWPVLKSAVKDAREITRILTKYYQFEPQYTVSLYNQEATREEVFNRLAEFAETLKEEDNLVIYFSGHGYYDKGKEITYWIPVGGKMEPNFSINWINTETLISYLKPIKSCHIFLIIDSCFSGTLFNYRSGKPKGEDYKSRTALASGREEVVMDSMDGGHSPFAQGVIEVLENTEERYIRASELADKVKRFVSERGVGQSPVEGRILTKPHDQNGDFIFHLKITEAEAWARAVNKATAEGYKLFAEAFPESKHIEEANENHLWLKSKNDNTIQALRTYLNEYPKGKYFLQALQQLDVLEEEVLWRNTVNKDTLSAYFHYLHKYPEGKHAGEARNKTGDFDEDLDDKVWKKTLENNTPDGYKEYIDGTGDKKYLDQAQEKLDQIDSGADKSVSLEEMHWKQATNTNTYLSLLDFTQAYPDSKYNAQAKTEMELLDDIAYNKIKMAESSGSLTLGDKVAKCLQYFDQYPGAPNNIYVKKIKDRLQIAEIKRTSRGL